MEQVVINDANPDKNISLEDEAKLQDEKGIHQQVDDGRPDWLPEKFNSPEEMAKAYGELEGKIGQKSEETEEETPDPADGSPQQQIINAAEVEYEESGELSDKTYDDLAKQGITREMVEAYIAGQTAQNSAEEAELKEVIGGSEQYDAMAQWANENLSEAEIEAYDEAVTSGSKGAAKLAIQGMYSQYINATGGGSAPLLAGSTKGSGVETFRSVDQVRQAMADPRYQTDPAYRQQVAQRLQHSNVM